jgi:hypothetical protein
MKKNEEWDTEKVVELINLIENEFDVHEWSYNDIHIWPLLRIQMSFKLDKLIQKNIAVKKVQLVKKVFTEGIKLPFSILSYWNTVIKDSKNTDRIIKKIDTILITDTSHRRFLIKNKWYDVFCDPLIDTLERNNVSSLILESTADYHFKIPRYRKSIFIQPQLSFLLLKNILNKKEGYFSEKYLSDVDRFHRFLISKNLSFLFLDIDTIRFRVNHLILLLNYFKKILTKLQPIIVFYYNYYGFKEMAINLACRELNIPTVDVQHGVQGDMHIAYGQWNKLPKMGYELLPSIFWNWSCHEKETIIKWSRNINQYHKPLIGSNLLLNIFNNPNHPVSKSFNRKIDKIKKQNVINIIISLQTGLGFPEIYRKLLLLSQYNHFFWIRLHPNMIPNKKDLLKILNDLKVSNFNIEEATFFPLYALLPQMDVHITETSSVVIEAECFNIPSIIIHESGELFFKKQIDQGIAQMADSPAKILDLINNYRSFNRYKSKKNVYDTSEALKYILKYIKNKKVNYKDTLNYNR